MANCLLQFPPRPVGYFRMPLVFPVLAARRLLLLFRKEKKRKKKSRFLLPLITQNKQVALRRFHAA
jgi:hypothetical protein